MKNQKLDSATIDGRVLPLPDLKTPDTRWTACNLQATPRLPPVPTQPGPMRVYSTGLLAPAFVELTINTVESFLKKLLPQISFKKTIE
jgi:hypothetical protein